MNNVALILFSRAPRMGETKTRLAQEIGAEAARDFHLACLQDIIDLLGSLADQPAGSSWQDGGKGGGFGKVSLYLFITPPGSVDDFRRAGITLPDHFQIKDQSGPDLGQRMAQAFQTVLEEAPANTSALLMGSDLPLLQKENLLAALQLLEDADALFGPAVDGGYYLVGLKYPCPELFALKNWGEGDVLQETIARAGKIGLRTALTATLPDADTLDDLKLVSRHPLFAALAHRRAVRFIQSLLGK